MSDSSSFDRFVGRTSLRTSLLLAVPSLVLIGGSAFAQSVDIPAIMDADLKAPPTAVTVQYGHQFKADVEDLGTEMSRNNAFLSLAHRVKLSEKSSFFALGSYTLHAYDFDNNPNLASNYQWDDVHRLVIGGLIGYEVNEEWRLIGGGLVRSWGEGGADFGDTITGGVIFGFDYHPSEDFSAGLLVGAFSALEDSVGLLPVPTMKWKFAEEWRWDIGMVTVFDPGVGTELSWQVAETVSIGTGFAFQNRRYRLDDKTRAVGALGRTDGGGVGQETEIPVFATVQWRPTPKSSINLLAGVALAGNVRVESSTGGRLSDDDYEAAPFVGFKGAFFF